MDFYVNTRGFSPNHAYRWAKVMPNGQTDSEPLIVLNQGIEELVYASDFSILIGQSDGKLYLLVTGLPTKQRTDFQGARIRNIIACITENYDKEEPSIRGIAISALKDKDTLGDLVDKHVIVDTQKETQYRVSYEMINDLRNLPRPTGYVTPNSVRKIGNNIESLRSDLAKELTGHKLPQIDGFLIIVTRNIEPSKLENSKVWRGLSDLVTGSDWIPYEEKPADPKVVGTIILLLILVSIGLMALILQFRGG